MSPNLIVISSPEKVPAEISRIRALLLAGLQQFHVRKSGFTDFDMINYITSIPKQYRNCLVLHSHYHLAKEFGLKGIQVGKNRISEAAAYKNNFDYFGYSAHTFDEIHKYKKEYTHFFLSPIHNSISKEAYMSTFSVSELKDFLEQNTAIKIVALGGIDSNNCIETLQIGFSGIALLGAIWQKANSLSALQKIQTLITVRAFVLSIAGFDPSSGAGITADIKTFEQHKVQGLGVTTAITCQNESYFLSVDWLSFEQIKRQIDVLFSKYQPEFVKIGLIENFEVLKQIITHLKALNNSVKIVWDPIIKASANFDFHTDLNKNVIQELLEKIYLITPNLPECMALFGTTNVEKVQAEIRNSKLCYVLIKGGHSQENKGTDVLVECDNIGYFEGRKLANQDKHGTGCVLSSAICANLAKGLGLAASIKNAKDYVTDFIESNNGLLGYHTNSNK